MTKKGSVLEGFGNHPERKHAIILDSEIKGAVHKYCKSLGLVCRVNSVDFQINPVEFGKYELEIKSSSVIYEVDNETFKRILV